MPRSSHASAGLPDPEIETDREREREGDRKETTLSVFVHSLRAVLTYSYIISSSSMPPSLPF